MIELIAPMHIIFKTIAGTQGTTNIFLKNVKPGFLTIKSSQFKKEDARQAWIAINVMDGWNKDTIHSIIYLPKKIAT